MSYGGVEIGGALVACTVASLFLTAVVRKAALARSILDYPNERSSHVSPTPRGGGAAIVAVVLGFITFSVVLGVLDRDTGLAVAIGAAAIAVAGWIDDLRPLPATARLAIHTLAAIWSIVWLGGLPALDIGTGFIHFGVLGFPLAVVGLVWSVNLFNFMDGIDGIAAIEAISVAGVGGLLLLASGALPLAAASLALAAACVGFLRYNWSPAQIFMGDVGSGFLGFMLGVIAVASENAGYVPLLVWAILAAVFIVDATITFARRLLEGHWRVAHRSHAYQRLVRAGWSHGQVAGAVAVMNVVLATLAILATRDQSLLVPALVVAFAIVTVGYVLVERARPFSED